MKIGIIKEQNDRRVAMLPGLLPKVKEQLGVEILVEKGAGSGASLPDDLYAEHATIVDRKKLLAEAGLIVSVNPLSDEEHAKLSKETVLVSRYEPYNRPEVNGKLKELGLTAYSLDMIPRTTLAQAMDVLSSMASIAGYRAVLVAAENLTRYFPMMITAAGSIRPARVLVLGAGVAGLQAIATARRLGAMVEAFDTRAAAKEEVQSLGAKFVEVAGARDDTSAGGYAVEQSEEFLQRQRAEVQERASKADVIITTAQVRGRKAPLLVPEETIEKMKPGAVIVDLAASSGGNCAFTQDRQTIQHNGVTIIGDSDLSADMPEDASL
ncbi:MAG: NAD(P) transhydrogenase subunit alpha, partial [Saprospiraceae bacterium]|nr:NAD(P) transhydrogenase subunit alpha [Saprospiraceae bacterium]